MIWRNTPERYGAVAKGFHWLTAAIVVGVLAVGLYMADLEPAPFKFKLSFWHKSFGTSVLVLVALRLLWRFINIRPGPLPTHKKWERVLAKTNYALMYLLLFAMPLTGWMMSSAKGFGVSVFGWFTLPDIIAENKDLGRFLRDAHGVIGNVLIVCIVLHFVGALKHHFIDRDATLRRMLPFGRAALALLFLAAAPAARAEGPSALDVWIIDHGQSRLSFEATQQKAKFEGVFEEFGGIIVFDPGNPATGMAAITVDMKSVRTGNPDIDSHLPGSAWLFTESFPEATFTTNGFEKTGADSYVAHANLTIRDVTLPVDLPFTLHIMADASGNKTAAMQGELTLQRLDYGVGGGAWKDTSVVGNEVKVTVSIVAHAAAH